VSPWVRVSVRVGVRVRVRVTVRVRIRVRVRVRVRRNLELLDFDKLGAEQGFIQKQVLFQRGARGVFRGECLQLGGECLTFCDTVVSGLFVCVGSLAGVGH